MIAETPITIEGALIITGFAGTLWAIFSVYQRMTETLREQRIILNIVCKHLGISPDEILGGKE